MWLSKLIKVKPTSVGFIQQVAVLWVLVAIAMLPLTSVADPITAVGEDKNGVGRMTFTWPSPVPFLARLQNKQIII